MHRPVATTRRVPEGMRVYCVGDIHGRDDLLGQMAERVKADMKGHSFERVVTVFLGDYVDRGFGSMRVVERLSRSEWPTSIIALAGNHEDLLLAFLEDDRVLELGVAWVGSKPSFLRGECRLGLGGTRFQKNSSGSSRRVCPSIIVQFLKTAYRLDGDRRLLLLSCRSKAGRASRSPGSR